LGAAADAVVDGAATGAGFGAGAAALGTAANVRGVMVGLFTIGFVVFVDAGAAVPRYGMDEVEAGGFGLATPGIAAGRIEPFVWPGWLGPSFL